ncbi:MAG: 50S ribosomal protein L19 [Candidatus Melainabacteria bacterium RIFCSPHIGHO2_02_FULL_34_12]|nr:MAG: 50S ribosomal protein L19 [Candidatus Melainabacteria bacterium RIFCSPHIGHO2_02_FULL_34_12]
MLKSNTAFNRFRDSQMHLKIKEIISNNLKKDIPNVRVGDTVKVTVRIKEGAKERSQNYEGVIIKIKGSSINKTFTVRRIFQGIGVERVFFLHSPKIEKITVLRSGKSRRAKLYYLRERVGKSTKLKEIISSSQGVGSFPKEVIPEEGKLVEIT